MLPGDKAAVICSGGVISGAPASAQAGRPVKQIAEAPSGDVATVTGKCRRPATISWWTSALAGGLFRIPHTNPAGRRPGAEI